jgi:signal transduction histidine kinase
VLVAIGGGWLLQQRSTQHLELAAKRQTQAIAQDLGGLVSRLREISSNALIINSFVDPLSVEYFLKPFFRSLRFGDLNSSVIVMTDFSGQIIASNETAPATEGLNFISTSLDRVIGGEEILTIAEDGSLVAAVPILVGTLPEGGLFIKLDREDTRNLITQKNARELVWVETADGGLLYGPSSESDKLPGADGAISSNPLSIPGFPDLSITSAVVSEEQSQLVRLLHGFLLLAFLLDLAALVVGIYMAASLVATPLNNLVSKIQTFQGLTGPEVRLATDGPDEIANLAHAFNDAANRQTDLTQRLEEALASEQELNNLQRQFVSLVSHEFRTPLAIVDGNAQLVLRKIETISRDRIGAALEKSRTAVARLIELMETVLSSSKLESGMIEFNPTSCALIEIVSESIENQQQISKTHRIVSTIDQLPESIVADRKLVSHIFTNLLSNAVKYSPNADTVWIDGYLDAGIAVISVRDEGVGIPENQMENLFGQFFRARTAQGIAGTGIGLYLVKKLVEMHGGSIQVQSVENQGSTFEVRLPVDGPIGSLEPEAVVPMAS